MTIDEASLRDRIGEIEDPLNGMDLASMGLVNDVTIEDGTAEVSLAFNSPYAPAELELGDRIREVVEETGLEPDLVAQASLEHGFQEQIHPWVRNVIAVASGKGGVGKTTVAANLAAGIEDRGAMVGVLDADIHGPNIPRILPIEGEPGVTPDGELVPPRSDGVRVMSMRFMTEEEDDPAILRGPMVNNVMHHFHEKVEWGVLDYLIVDLPPGTGDASLELLQRTPIVGTVLVTTPQQMALDDARKGLRMFEEHDAPILGIVENMSAFQCPSCGDAHEFFGSQAGLGAREICEDYDVPFLGQLPLHPDIGADGTEDPVVKDPDSPVQERFDELVGDILDHVGRVNRRTVAEHVGELADADGTAGATPPEDTGETTESPEPDTAANTDLE